MPDLQLDPGVPSATSVELPGTTAPAEDLDFDLVFEDAAATPVAATTQSAASAGEAVAEIEGIDFDSLSAISGDAAAAPAAESTGVERPSASATDEAEAIELSDADFEKHFHSEAAKPDEATVVFDFAPAAPVVQPVASSLPETFEFSEPAPLQEVPAMDTVAAEATDSVLPSDGNGDEQVKVIGSLRIGIPLYNVYLNEADEWSRRLVTEVAEWSLERNQPVSDSTVALAHSLAGSSATVGFDALSEMARAFEQALQQSRAHHSNGAAKYGQIFVNAAEDIRRLLHQFAAGFLKEPDAGILDNLRELDFSDSILAPGSDSDFDFSGEPAVEPIVDSVLPPELEAELQRQAQAESEPEVIKAEAPPTPAPVRAVPPPVAVVAPPVRLVTPAAAPAASQFDSGEDDEIDAVDAIDPDLFPIFEEEAAELMPQLGGALRQWSARPDNQGARMEVLRALHTLKGSARLAGALRMGEMAHRIESEIEFLGSDAAASQAFDPLLTRFDAMEAAFETLRHADAVAAAAPVVLAPIAAAEAAPKSAPVEEAAPDVQEAPVQAATPSTETGSRKLTVPAPQSMAMQPLRQAASASIRVRSQLLDRMVNQAGEVMITRSRLEAELSQLRGSL
ncbi:MAG: Hpt domain-containing protein, partial [Polaromonas sp.]|nr:Hpt domain-containing protein [Polaromonas sp.]